MSRNTVPMLIRMTQETKKRFDDFFIRNGGSEKSSAEKLEILLTLGETHPDIVDPWMETTAEVTVSDACNDSGISVEIDEVEAVDDGETGGEGESWNDEVEEWEADEEPTEYQSTSTSGGNEWRAAPLLSKRK